MTASGRSATHGPSTWPDRVAQFEADIAASPEALSRLLDRWVTPDLGGRSRLVVAGLGSSRFAAMPVVARLRASGASAWVEHASTDAGTAPGDDLVLFAVSASGRTSEVVAAARRHRGRSLVVAVTNQPRSPLADAADVTVALDAGEETGGIACRTFRATVAALALATGVAAVDELRAAVADLAALHADRATWAPALVDALDGAPSVDVLAPGSMLGAAEQAALMLREAPRLPAHAVETGDWLHTHVYLALPGHRVLLFPGAAADEEVADTVRRRGGEIVSVPSTAGSIAAAGSIAGSAAASIAGREPDAAAGSIAGREPDAIRRAIVESVVAEVVAAESWRRASAT